MIAALRAPPAVRVSRSFSPRTASMGIALPAVSGSRVAWVGGEGSSSEIYVWDGHYYAIEVVDRLGLMDVGGMLRIGLGQYNTADEVDVLLDRLESLVA